MVGALVLTPPVIAGEVVMVMKALERERAADRRAAAEVAHAEADREIQDLFAAGMQGMKVHPGSGGKVAVGIVLDDDGRWRGAVALPTTAVATTEVDVSIRNVSEGTSATAEVTQGKTFLFGTQQYSLLVADVGISLSLRQRAQALAVVDGRQLSGEVAVFRESVPTMDRNQGPLLA